MLTRWTKPTVLLLGVSTLAFALPTRSSFAQTVLAPSSQMTPTEATELHPVAVPSTAAPNTQAGNASTGTQTTLKPVSVTPGATPTKDVPSVQTPKPATVPTPAADGATSPANDNAEPSPVAATPQSVASPQPSKPAVNQAQGRPQQYTVASEAAAGMRLQSVPQDLRSPSIALDGLFAAIGGAHIYPDFKTAADATPDMSPTELVQVWRAAQKQPDFDLKKFVSAHFTESPVAEVSYKHKANEGISDYIGGMWDVLTRGPDKPVAYSSLLPLPYAYVVPGGRFSELYYWDTYFTMIGLDQSGQFDLMRGMIRDMASQIDRYGHIPNGTRTYYLSRSEPPFFAMMIDLLAQHDGPDTYTAFLPELQREYDYWMDGATTLVPGHAYRHVVRLADGTLLNRHWDDLDTPRDESYPEDVATANSAQRPPEEVYRDLRAGSETGWDFSSRWLSDGHNMNSIHTTDIATIELNSLIAHLEQTLAHAYALKGEAKLSSSYGAQANDRVAAIQRLMWSPDRKAFFDYDWKSQRQSTVLSAATVVPLFLHLATPQQASAVADTVRDKLLKTGGIVATDRHSGQQWDAPNGWAPLEWMAVSGFNSYGSKDLAADIAQRWMTRVIGTYEKSGVLLEKYDVEAPTISPTGGAGGGEYPMQIGFGWTNGTLLGLMNRYPTIADHILQSNPVANQAPLAAPATSANASGAPAASPTQSASGAAVVSTAPSPPKTEESQSTIRPPGNSSGGVDQAPPGH